MNHTATHQAGTAGASPQNGPEKLPGIRHIVAIGSGKGGVGKWTVSDLTIVPSHELVRHGPSPCDACRFAERCREQLQACSAFSMFLHGFSKVRWRIAPRVPTRERYQTLLGND